MRRTGTRKLFSHPWFKAAMAVLSVLCAAPSDCGGGGGGGAIGGVLGIGGGTNSSTPTATFATSDPTLAALATTDVDTILRQASHEAVARGRSATIAIVDRLGNVLAVAQTTGVGLGPPPAAVKVTSGRGVVGGLEGVAVPSTLAAIAKAVTGAFLSSDGNAFSTRTASQIIQEHFNPGITDTPGGPLFGVQFSQLPCSDFNLSFNGGGAGAGPQHSPLGLSADSGGLPIYINGVLVGGIGVVTKTTYTLDLNIFDFDVDNDEVEAIAGVHGYNAPGPIQAQNISVGGVTLRYSDATEANLAAPAAATGTYTLVAVPGFFGGALVSGQTYGSVASGIRSDNNLLYPGLDAFVFDNGTGVNRFAPIAGFAPAVGAITAAEAQALVRAGIQSAESTRAQIRIPSNSFAELNVAVVDLDGNVLAMARTRDAALFGADVSIQKARSVVFFSRNDTRGAFALLNATGAAANSPTGKFSYYVSGSSVNFPTLFNMGTAFSDNAIGNLSRPFYPDGIDGSPPGPLSLPFSSWSEFNDGLQLDLVVGDIANAAGGGAASPAGCASGVLPTNGGGGEPAHTPLANGLQIFPGAVPIYRGSVLVGGVGVSGDGIDQDDLTSFIAVQNGPATLNQAAAGIRSDQLSPLGVRLRYVNCPFAPFLNSSVQNAC
jgi:uncharacterized protein GlcG (DUF336 family)